MCECISMYAYVSVLHDERSTYKVDTLVANGWTAAIPYRIVLPIRPTVFNSLELKHPT